jgi:hypothetical protein
VVALHKVEEPIMDEISNTTGVNLVKAMFGIFLTFAIRINNIAKRKEKNKYVCESYDFSKRNL